MTTTPHLALPLLAAAQAQKHVTHNEALSALDALVHLAVKERERTTAPATPEEGDRYLVGSGATGAFANHEGEVAFFDLGIWRFFAPRPGWRVYVQAENRILLFDGSEWRDLSHYIVNLARLDNIERLGIGTAADDLNRFAAKLNAALLAALEPERGGTGDLRMVLNKSGAANVLSQLYQRGFSGRAETGLIGTDDFSIRVSPDGSVWRDAMRADRHSGVVSFPSGLADLPGENLLINPDFQVNQRQFAGGDLALRVYGFDRWKAGATTCTINRASDGMITLTGPLEQVVEVANAPLQGERDDLAGATLTLSVQDPSAPLPVAVGSKTAVIPAGSGRRSVTVTLASYETGDITVRLEPAGPCSFRRVKLEIGAYPTPWRPQPRDLEELRCRRYYQRIAVGLSGILGCLGQRTAENLIDVPYILPLPMRDIPNLVTSGFSWSSGAPSGNQVGFYDVATASWVTPVGSMLAMTALPNGPAAVVLRFWTGGFFSGTRGVVGQIHFGNEAFMALDAEL